MGLEKAIKSGKEKRKEYNGSKSWDRTCRNHGSCGRCKKDRIHKYKKQELCASDKLRDFKWWQRQQHVLHYPTLHELLTSLKGIGANQVTGHRSNGLGGRNRWMALQQAYEYKRDDTGLLPISYEVCYGVLTR